MGYKNPNYMKEYRQRNKKTPSGWLTKVYGRMMQSSKDRCMDMPSFTKKELWDWIPKDKFNKLFKSWIMNGCCKELTPSINRLNDYEGYSFSNMELTIWKDNNLKGRGSIRVKELVHSKLGNIAKKIFSKPVAKSTLDDKVLCVYPSAREAARQNNTDSGAIARVCRGEKHTHHKLRWHYI